MKKVLILALAFAAVVSAQTVNPARFAPQLADVVLVAAGTTVTIQQPAVTAGTTNPAKQVILESFTVYCSVACNVTQASNGGTAASTTAVAGIVSLPPNFGTPATALLFTASNVASGVAMGPILHLSAGQTIVICLNTSCGQRGNVQLGAGGGGLTNYSVSVSSITGTANIAPVWSEL